VISAQPAGANPIRYFPRLSSAGARPRWSDFLVEAAVHVGRSRALRLQKIMFV